MTRKSRREIERTVEELTTDDTDDGDEIHVVTVGGDPDAGGTYTRDEYRERFAEDPPGEDDSPTVFVEDSGGP